MDKDILLKLNDDIHDLRRTVQRLMNYQRTLGFRLAALQMKSLLHAEDIRRLKLRRAPR